MKKIFLSPFFMLVSFLVMWLLFMGSVYFFFPEEVLNITKGGALIEHVTHLGYIGLLVVLMVVCDDYKDNIRSWGMFLFLSLCAFLREMGIHHHLSRTDTTPFKSRFFLNPNNLISEKIIYGALLLVVFGAVLYLAIKYSKHLVRSFLKFDTVTWSVAVLCTVGVAAKIIDRFPAKWRKAHGGVPLSDEVYQFCQLVEESGEMFLPYIAMLILWQYHLMKKSPSFQR